jgi:hypothetical protein
MFAHFGEDWVREHHFDKVVPKKKKAKTKKDKKRGH